MENTHPLLSIIVITYNSANEIAECINALIANSNADIEVIVIDNNSPDGITAPLLQNTYGTNPLIKLHFNKENTGFARACNQGVQLARGKYISLLNPDTIAPIADILKMADYMEQHPDIGVLGPRIVDEHGVTQESYGNDVTPWQEVLGKIFYSKYAETIPFVRNWKKKKLSKTKISEVGWIGGACLLMSRELYARIDGIDPYFFFSHGDMIDLCKRVKNIGYKVVLYPEIKIVHTGSKSVPSNRDQALRSAYLGTLYMFKKYYGPGTVFLVKTIYVTSSLAKSAIAFPLSLFKKNPYRAIAAAHFTNAFRILTGTLEYQKS